MGYVFYNPNPVGRFTMDCMPRALTKALDIDWDTASVLLCNAAINMATVECSNETLTAVLRQHGFYREVISNDCPDCYTAEEFCNDNPKGIYILGFWGHVCCAINGTLYDTTDTRKEVPIYFWYKHD